MLPFDEAASQDIDAAGALAHKIALHTEQKHGQTGAQVAN